MNALVVATHDGNFHLDDCFAVATLKLCYGQITIVRTRDEATYEAADLRVDIGRRYNPQNGDFDHHQSEGAGKRENGIPYASFGLVWRQYGEDACGGNAAAALSVERTLVQQVDASDNAFSLYKRELERVEPATLVQIFRDMIPEWDQAQDFDAAFESAVELAGQILNRRISHAKAAAKAPEIVFSALAAAQNLDPRIIILPADMPWTNPVVSRSNLALYVVYPGANGMWRVKCVPEKMGNLSALRKPLPEAWAGKTEAEFVAATGVNDAFFCHAQRFVAATKTREGAIRLAKLAADA